MHSTTSFAICQQLDEISTLMLGLCDIDSTALSTKISGLCFQITIQAGFDEIGRLIRKQKPVPVRRMGFNLKKLSENSDSLRWSQLQTLDFRTLIFCTLSFPALALMQNEQFDWLVNHAEDYTQAQAFPPAWMATDQIRKAIAKTPRLECTREFWNSKPSMISVFTPLKRWLEYHHIELEVCNDGDSQDALIEIRDDFQKLDKSDMDNSSLENPQTTQSKRILSYM